ncbi:hypothetical protein J5N97_016752 [Dioscorea zingiberensis]|uniref:Uncharacterized protein n=1 Tax=Dioscorea zingiberensis TaxID=325984 RepID=A0A9D5CLQ3_9LILI|nr:hypothetical protein J5N97_016752 [Dioscorea zingiberensis]
METTSSLKNLQLDSRPKAIIPSNSFSEWFSLLALVAIAKRRRLLNDDVLVALADTSWDILDISGSDVTDLGLAKVAQECSFLKAVDISRCEHITTAGVSALTCHCRSFGNIEILGVSNLITGYELRLNHDDDCRGCPRSEASLQEDA